MVLTFKLGSLPDAEAEQRICKGGLASLVVVNTLTSRQTEAALPCLWDAWVALMLFAGTVSLLTL